jgi:hypothetical protein
MIKWIIRLLKAKYKKDLDWFMRYNDLTNDEIKRIK